MTVHRIETQFAGRPLIIETGRMAKQAAGSALVRSATPWSSPPSPSAPNISTLPFFPLTVEYREKTYAAGKIPGGYIKREGRPSRQGNSGQPPHRPLDPPAFPEGFKNEVQVFVYRHLRRSGK